MKQLRRLAEGAGMAFLIGFLLYGAYLSVSGLAREVGRGAFGGGVARAQTGAGARSEVIYNAYDVTSTTFVFNSAGGSGANDGWVTVQGEINKIVQIDIITINATSLDFIIQGRLFGTPDGTARQIWPASGDTAFTTAGEGTTVLIPDPVYQLRVGVKVDTDGGIQDLNVTYNSTP